MVCHCETSVGIKFGLFPVCLRQLMAVSSNVFGTPATMLKICVSVFDFLGDHFIDVEIKEAVHRVSLPRPYISERGDAAVCRLVMLMAFIRIYVIFTRGLE